MKKLFKQYVIIWAILFAVYNAIVFLIIPDTVEIQGVTLSKYAGSFWPGYIGIIIAFFGNLFCSKMFFDSNSPDKAFLNMPLLRLSWGCLIVTMIVGTLTMAIIDLPNWIGALLCILLLAFYAIAVVKASVASDVVEEIDNKVKAKTSTMKLMIADAEAALSNAKSEELKAEAKKVYEALRYSDPMSNDALSAIEGRIADKLLAFNEAVSGSDEAKAKTLAEEICTLVNDRNVKCKVLK